jgi:hypothetical protein
MTLHEFKECLIRFFLLKASIEFPLKGFFHSGGGFLISNEKLKINLFEVGQAMGEIDHEKRTH